MKDEVKESDREEIAGNVEDRKTKKFYLWVILIMVIALIAFFVLRGRDLTGKVVDEEGGVGEVVEGTVEDLDATSYMKEQQVAIMQARRLYGQKRREGMKFSSQCLGIVGRRVKYAVDIVHVPRNREDDRPENQCEAYRKGEVKHFIELDRAGNIFRIV